MKTTKNILLKVGRWSKKKIKAYDMYPNSVAITYKGKQKFTTLFGGIVSIVISLSLFVVAIVLCIKIFQRANTTISMNNQFKDNTDDTRKHYFSKNKEVYFAIGLIGPNPEILLDKTYFNLQIVQVKFIRDSSPSGFTSISTPIEFEKCGTNYPYVSSEIASRINLGSYL